MKKLLEESSTPETNNDALVENPNDSSGFNWKKVILTILIVVPVGFLIFGGILYFSNNLDINKVLNKKEAEKTLEIPEPTPVPTVVEVDKTAYVIEVQNGSGIAGEAASVKETLDNEGFMTGDTGNADNSDYTLTIIRVNNKVSQEFIDELTAVLEKRGPVGKVEKFAEGEDGEVLVIIGSNLADSTPTPTP